MSAIIPIPPQKWRDLLRLNPNTGTPSKMLYNACIIARHAPELKGAIAFDEFRQTIVKVRELPWHDKSGDSEEWTEVDNFCFVHWCESGHLPLSDNLAWQAALLIAKENRFHPARDWLRSLVWDRRSRLDNWLTYYLGVNPTNFSRAVGAKWVISSVARVMNPGCQADHVLILEGAQGIRKSTALRTLAGSPWFTDTMGDVRSKDAAMQIQGVLVVEMGELDHLSKTDSTAMKAFLTTRIDRFRPPYGRLVANFPRQCVFAGTVNDDRYFKDTTGNRRYWPVTVTSIDLDALKEDREQLWAEAYARYRDGETWYLDDEEVVRESITIQRERIESDPWEEKIAEFVAKKDLPFLIDTVMIEVERDIGKWNKSMEMRVAKCLTVLGFRKMREASEESYKEGRGRVKSRTRRNFWGTDEMFGRCDSKFYSC